ncbi:MAG: toprim domain-containing protein [Gammaproteobacteria bacterium]|nr:toprim domain-containing protein [Gammaproteobacteria bacterium]
MTDYFASDLISAALDALRASGLAPHDVSKEAPVFDGVLHRYRVEGDKAGSRNGWMVWYGDGLPSGAFGSWKTGQSETWCIKREDEITPAEKAQREQHLAHAKAARQALEQQVHAHAQQRAVQLRNTARSTVAAQHPYLKNKQIPAMGIRQLQQTLVIPIHDAEGTLHSLQFIDPAGEKTFLTGGAIQGHFHLIGSVENARTVLICEGWATGMSLHQATRHPVFVAFNAGNLLPVGEAVHRLIPEMILVFCGDDDRWHPPEKGNAGREKALAAAQALNGFAIFPDFTGLDLSSKPTDFNDLHTLAGLPALKAQLAHLLAGCQPDAAKREALEREILDTDDFEALTTALPRKIQESGLPKPTVSHLFKRLAAKVKVPIADLRESAQPTVSLTGWKADLRYEDDGHTLKPMLANLVHILEFAPEWRNGLVLDTFSADIFKRRALPFPYREATWADIDSSKTRIWLEKTFDLSMTTLLVDEAIQVVGDSHVVHVIQEYLESLVWDGVPRLKTWPMRYLGAEDNPANRFIGQAWMVGAVKRAYEPGCKFDNVLVLEGPQGVGKSTVLAILGGEWHAESITDVGSKDSLMILRGKWIVEFAELDALGRVESSRIKQHISAPYDTYRPPYGRRTLTVPRQCVFAATCNPLQYLKDETGGRRFWPIRVGQIQLEALRRDRDQLWAEALALYRQGEQTWATSDMTYLAEAQEARYQTDPWEELIVPVVMDRQKITINELMGEVLLIERSRRTQAEKNRIAKILNRLGFQLKVTRENGVGVRLYVRNA